MNVVVTEGKTVEEAVELGCYKLKLSSNRVRFEVIVQPKKGFMGWLGGRKAKVRVEEVSLKREIHTFLEQLLTQMELKAIVTEDEKEGSLCFMLEGEALPVLIGKNGQTLESIQYIVQRVFAAELKRQGIKVTVDANNYRKKKERFVIGLSERMADLVCRTKKRVALDPMPAHERKLVHQTLQKKNNIKTESKGSDPKRYVVIHWNQ